MDATLESGLAIACQRAFPDRPYTRVENLTQINDGWECDVYAFALASDLVEKRTRDELILRVYQGPQAARKAETEFQAMSWLQRVGYPVPRVFAYFVDDSTIGRPFMIMENIEGQILGTAIRRAGAERRGELFHLFCSLLARLHDVDCRPFASATAPSDARAAVAGMLDWSRALLRQLGVADYDPVLDWLAERREAIRPGKLAVIHQDFHPWNVILRADGQAFVIDWTQADVSDSRFDLGWTLLLARASFDRTTSDLLLAEYERISSAAVLDVDFFLVVAAMKRLASITISLGGRAESLGMRAGAEAQMREQRYHLVVAYEVLREQTNLTIPLVEKVLSTLASP